MSNHLCEDCGICDTVPDRCRIETSPTAATELKFGLLSLVAHLLDRVRPRGYVPVEQLRWRGIGVVVDVYRRSGFVECWPHVGVIYTWAA